MDPDSYNAFLQPLPGDRRDAVKSWLGSTLKDCPVCQKPIRVMDSHRRIKDALVHTACAPSDA